MSVAPIVLDPASGSRMFYFDKADPRVLFGDKRREEHTLCDGRLLTVDPDELMDFRALPYPDGAFRVVVVRRARRDVGGRPDRRVRRVTPELPLVGHRSGKRSGTHWITFLKEPS